MKTMTPYVTNFNEDVMNDTILIKLKSKEFTITESWNWKPPLPEITSPVMPYMPFYSKYSLNRKCADRYYPKLTLRSYWNRETQKPDIQLTIDFSAPKILFNNNVDEIDENDYEELVKTLRQRLFEMGLVTSIEAISQSQVYQIHFSKNVLLSDYESVSNATRTIAKMDIPKRLKVCSDRFQNEGNALRIYNSQQQIVIYDKVKDSQKFLNEAEDKDRTDYQQKLLKTIKKSNKPLETLRLEIRILNRKKLNWLLQSLGFNQNPTLKEIFKRNISQAVLKYYWKLITPENSQFLLHYTDENTHKQIETYLHNKKIRKIHFIEALGIAKLIDNSKKFGIRDIEITSYINYSTRTWLRNLHYFDFIQEMVKETSQSNFLENVNKSLEVFEPLKVSQLSERVGLTFANQAQRSLH